MGVILVVGEVEALKLTDPSRELAAKAQELSQALSLDPVIMAVGSGAKEALSQSGLPAAIAVNVNGDYAPDAAERAVTAVIEELQPVLVLLPTTTLGMDVAAAVAARGNRLAVAYCVALKPEGQELRARCQVFGGKLQADVRVPLTGTVITVIPGSWPPLETSAATSDVAIRDIAADGGFEVLETMELDSGGDVDITRADILVSVGRGIQDPANLELADELASALGGVVSCSRPVVDAGWLPRSRQVGKSGHTVKPKCYLALGISGAPEHLQGMKDAELIIAINADPSAPIFEVAHYGATVDILDLMPTLTGQIQAGV